MKIATWNVERLRHKKQLDQIQGLCDGIHADILVLTETDKRLHPDYAFCCENTRPFPMPSQKIASRFTPTIPLFGCIKPMIRVPPSVLS